MKQTAQPTGEACADGPYAAPARRQVGDDVGVDAVAVGGAPDGVGVVPAVVGAVAERLVEAVGTEVGGEVANVLAGGSDVCPVVGGVDVSGVVERLGVLVPGFGSNGVLVTGAGRTQR